MGLNYTIITDPDSNFIVCINDIRFKGKRKINWNEVEEYLRQYIGEFYENADTKDVIYIGSEFPDEYTGSNDTARLGETEDVERYNVFRVEVLIRHSKDGNKYLYDLVNIKKETSTPLEP